MKQVIMEPRDGGIGVVDLPEPALRPGMLLVRNAFSVISPGTERNAVKAGRDSLLATARARPDLVRRVLDTVRREGVLAAYRKVQARRDEMRAPGYASAGTVIAIAPGAEGRFRLDDRVACAGAGYASHAEVIAVPTNLAARVPAGVDLEAAAFATLGAVALHGVRQSRAALGERFAVIGCGVLGLLTVQLLRAAGVRVAAFDLSSDLARRAREQGAEVTGHGSSDDQVAAALAWTDGVGVDGVIVTAASASDAPMVAAGGMCRERARITAVGLVPFGLPREIAYQKEIELTIARSYGPGRYDPDFEEKGIDYPIEHVRWTETRNLEAFLQLIAEKKIDPLALVTHRFGIEDAGRAYEMLADDSDAHPLGIVISYPGATPAGPARVEAVRRSVEAPRATVPLAKGQEIAVGFVGAGSFARSTLLPILKREKGVRLQTVVTTQGVTALQAQRRFGFDRIGTDPDLIFEDPGIHLVFIATRHDSHADLAVRALRAGKHVFVEKPLALNEEQLARVEAAAATAPGHLMVGFNRRYSPHARALREAFKDRGPLMMTYRVNAGPLPPGHWLNDPEVGGGRIIGEACHFVDLMSYIAGDAGIESIQVERLGHGDGPPENFSTVIRFGDGSIGQLLYTARGSIQVAKERLEVHGGGVTGLLDNFAFWSVHGGNRKSQSKVVGKGHQEELEVFLACIRGGGDAGLSSLRAILNISRATFLASHSIALERRLSQGSPRSD